MNTMPTCAPAQLALRIAGRGPGRLTERLGSGATESHHVPVKVRTCQYEYLAPLPSRANDTSSRRLQFEPSCAFRILREPFRVGWGRRTVPRARLRRLLRALLRRRGGDAAADPRAARRVRRQRRELLPLGLLHPPPHAWPIPHVVHGENVPAETGGGVCGNREHGSIGPLTALAYCALVVQRLCASTSASHRTRA